VSGDWDGTFLYIGARRLHHSGRLLIARHLSLSTCRDKSGRGLGVPAKHEDSGLDVRFACRDRRGHRSLDLPSRRFPASASLRSSHSQTRAGSAADRGLRCGESASRLAQNSAGRQSRKCERVRGAEGPWAMARGVRDMLNVNGSSQFSRQSLISEDSRSHPRQRTRYARLFWAGRCAISKMHG
jgi:hypothetical protein